MGQKTPDDSLVIFLSWSGPSLEVARAFHRWLPKLFPEIELFLSEETDKGTRWANEIANGLDRSDCGIICIAGRNANSPWLLFESGALSKRVEGSKIWTFILDGNKIDL